MVAMQWHGLKPIDRAPTQHTAQPQHERCSAGLPAYLSCFAPPSHTCHTKRWVIWQLDDFIPSFLPFWRRYVNAGYSGLGAHLHTYIASCSQMSEFELLVIRGYSSLTCLLVCFLVGRSLYFKVLMYYIFSREPNQGYWVNKCWAKSGKKAWN